MRFKVIEGDATKVDVDVLALKYAQSFYGLDAEVAKKLIASGEPRELYSPPPGQSRIVSSPQKISARQILFVGTLPLSEVGYLEIRVLARSFLSELADSGPKTRSLAVTLQGPNYGLDEAEAFQSMVAGFSDAIETNDYPKALDSIIMVEEKPKRAVRLAELLDVLLPGGVLSPKSRVADRNSRERLRSAGYASSTKPHAFVAMPFAKAFDDVYRYGIQTAVNKAGLLCERVDHTPFSGDVLSRIKKRISTAKLLIADLSTSSPNVYLEVGFAWASGVDCVLLVKDKAELKFDVSGQRCLTYESISELEEKLTHELNGLATQ